MKRTLTQEDLDRLIAVYKNGLNKWFRDALFLKDCAYYEGAIKKASEILGIEPPFKYLENITEELKSSFDAGYENFWIGLE